MTLLLQAKLFVRRHPQVLAIPFLLLLGFMVLSTATNSPRRAAPSAEAVRYAHQGTYSRYSNISNLYTIAVIADKDKSSKNSEGKSWDSELKIGNLKRIVKGNSVIYQVQWEDTIPIQSKLNEADRGMELSDLIYWNDQLLSFDDRTGIVYEIDMYKRMGIARHILVDGNGKSSSKGFKCEWATVKDDVLYIGSLGKEWTENGVIKSQDPQYVKTITLEGHIEHVSWVKVYQDLRRATGHLAPGYLIHEAVRFNPVNRRWVFLPRRASTEEYDDVADESRGSNIMITTNEHFEDIQMTRVGPIKATHGFSSFVFVPHREDEIIALKTSEFEGQIETYITAFNTRGEILLEETKIGDVKYEGIEFI